MTSKRYTHFVVRDTPKLSEVLTNMIKSKELHKDDDHEPYHHIELHKPVTVKRMQKLTGCDNITGVSVVQTSEGLIEMTRSSIALAKKEYEELIKKGKIIVQVLNEDNTSEEVLSLADRRAVSAYKKSLK